MRRGNLRKDQKGFTLLEFLIAVMVLSIGLLGMASLTGAMINLNRTAYNSTKAVTMAEEKMEELRNLNYQTLSSLPSSYDSESIFTRNWTLNNNVPDTNMTTIVVTVTWTWKGDSKSLSLRSVVGR